jgi:hypothetical protein
MRQAKVDEWMVIYIEELKSAITNHPSEYVYGLDQVPVVAERMKLAFLNGTYNHDSRAIKGTCKRLGIKTTRKAIEAYFNG